MTNKEAQLALANLKRYISGGGVIDRGTNRAIDMAIKALEHPEIIYCGDCKYKDDGIGEDGVPFLKCLHGRSYGGTRINDFCSWAERREDAESRWIPVTERLPEEDKDVLCKTLAGVIFVASYGKLHQWTDEKGWIITPSLERAGISFVDWWMPLPEFYKEMEE